MSSPVTTRSFEMADYDSAVRLWQNVSEIEICEGDGRDEVALFLQRNPGLSRVAMVDGNLAAIALCGHDGRRGHIYHLAVDREYQRRGLGRLLVKECLSGLRAAGILRAIILVAGDNAKGRDFWKEIGWEELDGALAMGIDP